MKVRLLGSTIESDGSTPYRQHLTSLVIDDVVAIDAGSLAMGCTEEQRQSVRDVVLTHAHLDHTAGLPLFIDDLFATLTDPVRIHATKPVIDILETHIFNWLVYPRFSELSNDHGAVVKYVPFEPDEKFEVRHLSVEPVMVNHTVTDDVMTVDSTGFIISDGKVTLALSGDSSEMPAFWDAVKERGDIDAIFLECAFPDELAKIANDSGHMTPLKLAAEIDTQGEIAAKIFVMNIKPVYRETVVEQLEKRLGRRISLLTVGVDHEF